MEELNVTLIAVLAGIITVVGGFITAVLGNPSLRTAVSHRLIGGIRGKQIISVEDLKRHDIKLKISRILATGNHKAISLISDTKRIVIFKEYIDILCEVFMESVDNILNTEFINFNESELKTLIIEQMAWRRDQYSTRLKEYLATLHNDNTKIAIILDKIERWRTMECEIINSSVLDVISSGRFSSVEYKLDVVLHQYALGIDVLAKNGADSFIKLNGELDDFLNIENNG